MTSRHANLWEETAIAAPPTPPLESSLTTDVLVIGAGYLGLSAALHLAEAGVGVAALDAEAPGWGASGRNGGQIIPGLKYDPDELEAMLGRERGERLWRFAGATADLVFDLAARHGLAAEAKRTAWVQGLHSPAAVERAKRRAEQWQRRGAAVEYLGAPEAAVLAGTGRYLGAFVDRRAGALHPLSYAREMCRAALALKARIHGKTRVTALARNFTRWRATTASGAIVEADTVIVATNAYADGLVAGLAPSIVAANSLQIATVPLPAAARRAILPGGEVLSDTRRIIRYWRLDRDGRLIMGGRGPYREPGPERDWAHLVRDVRDLFPALGDIGFTHRWGGRVAIHPDYMPRLHRPAAGLLVAIGCQGRGIGWQSAMGGELARIARKTSYDPVLPITPIAPIPFHRFKALGVSATIAAYRALDRLGVG
ncbi:MAG TPA: FAD-binding oxidoreductase [Stellaceae bacterium]|jgi:glycine/D-amino acid oxidase-like deaminating enzyme|nr:FAD-binding oxidoreductase [Stellaceae bacterium]